jgi:hypothetical protein
MAGDTMGQEVELATSPSDNWDSGDEATSDCINLDSDTMDQEDSGDDTAVEDDSPAETVDPSYVDDINSELQDQGIGVGKDQFSTEIHILGHTLKRGILNLWVG